MLATDLAFRELGLSEFRGTSVSTNLSVHSLHRKCGFKQLGVMHAAQTIGGKLVDLVQFFLRRRTGSKSVNVCCRWPTWPATGCRNGKKHHAPGPAIA